MVKYFGHNTMRTIDHDPIRLTLLADCDFSVSHTLRIVVDTLRTTVEDEKSIIVALSLHDGRETWCGDAQGTAGLAGREYDISGRCDVVICGIFKS